MNNEMQEYWNNDATLEEILNRYPDFKTWLTEWDPLWDCGFSGDILGMLVAWKAGRGIK